MNAFVGRRVGSDNHLLFIKINLNLPIVCIKMSLNPKQNVNYLYGKKLVAFYEM